MAPKYTLGRPLRVKKAAPHPGAGRVVQVYSRESEFTELLCTISDWISLMGGTILNDVGSCSLVLDLTNPALADPLPDDMALTALLEGRHLWRVCEDGKGQFEFIPDNVEYVDSDPDIPPQVTLTGSEPAAMLRGAMVLPPNFPRQPSSTRKFWSFKDTPIMSAWSQLFVSARRRGAVPGIELTFDSHCDSGGKLWADLATCKADVNTFMPDLGTDLLTLLNGATGQDPESVAAIRCDWHMWPGLKLDVRRTIGKDRSDTIIFHDGGDIIRRRHTVVTDSVANYVCVRDVYGGVSLGKDTTSESTYGHRELYFSDGVIGNSSTRKQIAKALKDEFKDARVSWTITVLGDVVGKKPFTDYNVGDTLGFRTYDVRTQTTTTQRLRVIAINILDAPGEVTVELTLETLLDNRIKELQRRVTYLLNKTDGAKVSVPPVLNITDDYPYNLTDANYALTPMENGAWDVTPIDTGLKVFFQDTEPDLASQGDMWVGWTQEAASDWSWDDFNWLYADPEADAEIEPVVNQIMEGKPLGMKKWLNKHLYD